MQVIWWLVNQILDFDHNLVTTNINYVMLASLHFLMKEIKWFKNDKYNVLDEIIVFKMESRERWHITLI